MLVVRLALLLRDTDIEQLSLRRLIYVLVISVMELQGDLGVGLNVRTLIFGSSERNLAVSPEIVWCRSAS